MSRQSSDEMLATTCGYAGCRRPASFIIRQVVGKQQEIRACAGCAPTWVMQGKRSPYYKVERIELAQT